MPHRKQHERGGKRSAHTPPKQQAQQVQQRYCVDNDIGPVAIIRREGGRVTIFPTIADLRDHAFKNHSPPAERNIKEIKCSGPWLAFWSDHIIALRTDSPAHMKQLLTCADHKLVDEQCIQCTALQSIVHLWLWEDPKSPILTYAQDGEQMLKEINRLKSVTTLSLPHALLEYHIANLRHLENVREIQPVRMAFTEGLALTVSWSFQMPQCHIEGHPLLKAQATILAEVSPGTVQDLPICAMCQAEMVRLWAEVRNDGACGNQALQWKAAIVKEGKGDELRSINRPGCWTRAAYANGQSIRWKAMFVSPVPGAPDSSLSPHSSLGSLDGVEPTTPVSTEDSPSIWVDHGEALVTTRMETTSEQYPAPIDGNVDDSKPDLISSTATWVLSQATARSPKDVASKWGDHKNAFVPRHVILEPRSSRSEAVPTSPSTCSSPVLTKEETELAHAYMETASMWAGESPSRSSRESIKPGRRRARTQVEEYSGPTSML